MATRKSEKRHRRSMQGKSLGAARTGESGKDSKKQREAAGVGGGRATAANVEAGQAPTSRGWAALAELLGRRAAMRVLWELRAAPLKFRELQAACDGLSPSTLNQRLSDLRDTRLVAIEERQGYRLTPQGEELVRLLAPLAGWADGWSHRRAQKRRTEGPPRKRARNKLG